LHDEHRVAVFPAEMRTAARQIKSYIARNTIHDKKRRREIEDGR
jgi:hypothetical protein